MTVDVTDFTTPLGQVRLLIADTDPANAAFTDEQITAFISMATGSSPFRAAALALRTLAANETLVQKKIRIMDLSTDGPATAAALMAQADQLEGQADAQDEATADAFDWAEMVGTPAQYSERLYSEAIRGS